MQENGISHGAIYYLQQAHEKRIDRLEEDSSELKTQLAECNANLRAMNNNLGEKLADLSDNVKEFNRTMYGAIQALDEKVYQHSERLSVLEDIKKRNKENASWFRDKIFPIFLTGIGALIMWGIQKLWG